MGKKQLEDLLTFCNFINRMQQRAAKDPAGELLQDLLTAIGYEAFLYDSEEPRAAETKWVNVMDFVGWLSKKGEEEDRSLLELTQTVALMSMLEGREEAEPDAVKLSTLHAAKGLEFGHVFLIGVEEGILPHRESTDESKVEEERRLMYVGITRAQKSLTITWCKKRKRANEWEQCEPSRFLDELPPDDVRHSGKSADADPAERKAQAAARIANIRAIMGK
jgi:ATP-dependent DNA helicase Rep